MHGIFMDSQVTHASRTKFGSTKSLRFFRAILLLCSSRSAKTAISLSRRFIVLTSWNFSRMEDFFNDDPHFALRKILLAAKAVVLSGSANERLVLRLVAMADFFARAFNDEFMYAQCMVVAWLASLRVARTYCQVAASAEVRCEFVSSPRPRTSSASRRRSCRRR